MSDRICIMGKGRIAQVGTPQELYDRPRSRYVADFVGKANIVSGQITGRQGGMAQAVLGNGVKVVLRDEPGDARTSAEIAVRPEALALALRESAVPAGTTAVPARITHRTFLGSHTEYLLTADGIGPLQVNIPRQAERALGGHDVGASVHVLWPEGTGLVLAADD